MTNQQKTFPVPAGILEISGDDARTFLHAQFTTDVNALAEGQAQFSAWCNPKGRVISTFYLLNIGASYFLLLPPELKDTFYKRLKMYVLRSNVVITDRSNDMSCFCTTDAINIKHVFSFQLPGDKKHHILFGEQSTLQSLYVESPDSTHWQLHTILSGIPWLNSKNTEEYLPQELNLEQLNALSLKKGCFPGQEIVARVHYRGQVKRGMKQATLAVGQEVETGMKLYAHGQERAIGTILNSCEHPDNCIVMLIVVENDYLNADKLFLDSDLNYDTELQIKN